MSNIRQMTEYESELFRESEALRLRIIALEKEKAELVETLGAVLEIIEDECLKVEHAMAYAELDKSKAVFDKYRAKGEDKEAQS